MLFDVRAIDEKSQLKTFQLEGLNAADARQQALHMRCTPISVQLSQDHGSVGNAKVFDVALFAEELQMLLNAGLSMIEAIEGLMERETAAARRAALAALASCLRGGEGLADAMGRQPDVFPELFSGIVRSAEVTSSLAAALEKYVAYERHVRMLRERMISATIYPGILLIVGSGVTLFLMMYVVPRFAAVYRSSGRPLPWVSQWLLDTGVFLNQNMLLVLGLVAGVALFAWHGIRRKGTAAWLILLQWLPGARPWVATIEMARLFRTLSMLLHGGLPVRDALRMSAHVMSDERQESVEDVRRRVEGGAALSDSLVATGLSTPLALRLLRVGERSGQLGAMLERAAAFHEHETAQWIDRLSRTFAPMLMVFISVLVGAVVIFLYMPVFDLAASFQG